MPPKRRSKTMTMSLGEFHSAVEAQQAEERQAAGWSGVVRRVPKPATGLKVGVGYCLFCHSLLNGFDSGELFSMNFSSNDRGNPGRVNVPELGHLRCCTGTRTRLVFATIWPSFTVKQ